MSKYNELVTKLREVFQIDRPELDFGIYRILNARAGEINDFTGVNAPFEIPSQPFLEIHTDTEDVETSVQKILDNILPVLLLESRNT